MRSGIVETSRNIVVCGYPKSGTTWFSRLVAELVACPLLGDFGFAEGVAVEGLERISPYRCYKSHHSFKSLSSGSHGDYFRVVYIVRDPRDVAISAAHHFDVNVLPIKKGGNRFANALRALVNLAVPYSLRQRRTVHAVLYGDPSLSPWLAMSWREHYHQFLAAKIFIVRYEELLDCPHVKCCELLSYFNISRSDESIARAISNQSFRNRKNIFKSQGLMSEYAFLRRGNYGYWRKELGRRQRQQFVDELEQDLVALSYPID